MMPQSILRQTLHSMLLQHNKQGQILVFPAWPSEYVCRFPACDPLSTLMAACCSRQLGRVVQVARAARDNRGGALRQWLHHEAGGNAAEPQGRRAHHGLPNVAAPMCVLDLDLLCFAGGEEVRGMCKSQNTPFIARHTSTGLFEY